MREFNRLETLLLEKNFSALTDAEKSFVLHQMTALEFEEQQVLLRNSSILAQEELAAAPTSQEILAQLNMKSRTHLNNEESSGFLRLKDRIAELMNIRIPAWQVATVCLALGVMLFPMLDREKVKTELATPYVVIIDTIAEQVINPILNNKDSNNIFAIGAKLIDSNYLRVSEYNQRRQQKDLYMERLLSLTPIEL